MSAHRQWFEDDYYKVLGVDRRATEAEIARAYRRLAKQYHPDLRRGSAGSGERFRQIVEAKDVLTDTDRRVEYDRIRALIERPGAPTADERFGWSDTARTATLDENLAWAARRERPRRRRSGAALLILVLIGVAGIVAGMVLLASAAKQVERSLPTISIPSNFIPTQQRRIDQLARARNCAELDRQLGAAQVLDERQRQRGGQGYALRSYIEQARSSAGCPETETQTPPTFRN